MKWRQKIWDESFQSEIENTIFCKTKNKTHAWWSLSPFWKLQRKSPPKKNNFLDAPDPQCQRLGQLCIKWPTSLGWLVDIFNVTLLGFISYLNTSNKFQNRHLPKTKMQRKNWYPHSEDLVESPEKPKKHLSFPHYSAAAWQWRAHLTSSGPQKPPLQCTPGRPANGSWISCVYIRLECVWCTSKYD